MTVLILTETLLLCAVVYLLVGSIYRIYFHPLSKYPGPKLAALSNVYNGYYAWKGTVHLEHDRQHRVYGPIIRSGPNLVHFDSLTAHHNIYSPRANTRKVDGYNAISASRRRANTLSATTKEDWNFTRKPLAQFMSEKNIKEFQERIAGKIKDFISILGSNDDKESLPVDEKEGKWSSKKDIGEISKWLSFDIITDLSFGQTANLLNSPQHRRLPHGVTVAGWRGLIGCEAPELWRSGIDKLMISPGFTDVKNLAVWAAEKSRARASQTKDGDSPLDIFDCLLKTTHPRSGRKFDAKDLWVMSILFMGAGSETTSYTLAAVLFYLLHSPAALARATAEVRNTFDSEDDIRLGPALESCSFLLACINETMRVSPAVPLSLPRQVEPGGLEVDGHFLPTGTEVGVVHYTLYRNPSHFPKSPDAFWPERWVPDPAGTGVTDQDVQDAHAAFFPFGAGARVCVGQKLAEANLRTVLARVLWNYDMRIVADAECCRSRDPGVASCTIDMRSYISAWIYSGGPFAQFKRREDAGICVL